MKYVLVGMNKTIIIVIFFVVSSCTLSPSFDQLNFGRNIFDPGHNLIHILDNYEGSGKSRIQFRNQSYNALPAIKSTSRVNIDFDNLRLSLYMGKIIRTYGLENNFEIIDYTPFQDLLNNSKFESTALIRFTNPETNYMQLDITYKIRDSRYKDMFLIEALSNNIYLLEESFHVPQIRWKGINYYLIDSNNEIIESKQSLYFK